MYRLIKGNIAVFLLKRRDTSHTKGAEKPRVQYEHAVSNINPLPEQSRPLYNCPIWNLMISVFLNSFVPDIRLFSAELCLGRPEDIELAPTERCAEKKKKKHICMEFVIDQTVRRSVMRIIIDSGGRQHSCF